MRAPQAHARHRHGDNGESNDADAYDLAREKVARQLGHVLDAVRGDRLRRVGKQRHRPIHPQPAEVRQLLGRGRHGSARDPRRVQCSPRDQGHEQPHGTQGGLAPPPVHRQRDRESRKERHSHASKQRRCGQHEPQGHRASHASRVEWARIEQGVRDHERRRPPEDEVRLTQRDVEVLDRADLLQFGVGGAAGVGGLESFGRTARRGIGTWALWSQPGLRRESHSSTVAPKARAIAINAGHLTLW